MKRNFFQIAAVGALAAGMMFAQTAPVRNHNWASHRQQFMQQLNLTTYQQDQAKTIFQQARQSSQAVRAELKTNREALATAVRNDNQAQIQKLAVTQGQLRGQMIAARSEAAANFYKILTPAQRAKAEQLHQAFRQKMQERFGRMRTNS